MFLTFRLKYETLTYVLLFLFANIIPIYSDYNLFNNKTDINVFNSSLLKPFVKLVKARGEEDCQRYVDPSYKCIWKNTNEITIRSDIPCVFNCTYDPSKAHPGPIRLSVHLKSPPGHVFVSAEQQNTITSWTLPAFFKGANVSRPYTSVENILCPPKKSKNETVRFRISTLDPTAIINVSIHLVTYNITLGQPVTFTNSPISPWVKLYLWSDKREDSVLVSVETIGSKGDQVCTLLSLQNAECPIFSEQDNIRSHGHYQSFQSQGGMVAKRADFPAGIHIIVLPLPNDFLCTGVERNESLTSRKKSVQLTILPHISIGEKWGIFVGGAVLLTVIFSLSGFIFIKVMLRSIVTEELSREGGGGTSSTPSDQLRFKTVVRGIFALIFGRRNAEEEMSQSLISEDSVQSEERSLNGRDNGEENIGALVIPSVMSAEQIGSATYDEPIRQWTEVVEYHNMNAQLIEADQINPRLMQLTETFNPRYVLWQKAFSVFHQDDPDSQISQAGFQNSFLVIALFTAMPLAEILRSSLSVFGQVGSEDQCLFNNRCMVSFGNIPDFARVFSNIGYLLAANVSYFIIRKHKMNSIAGTKGVFRNYGILYGLSFGISLQGIMSSLYHICPNRVTIRADLMFMYILSTVVNVYIYGLRHGDVASQINPTIGMVGVMLILVEMKEYVFDWLFWVIVAALHSGLSISTAVTMIKNGTWSFSPRKILSNWRLLKPAVDQLREISIGNSPTANILTMIRTLLGLGSNLGLIILGISMDMNPYKYILLVCLVNMVLYLGHYLITKKLHGEKGTIHSWVCFLLSLIAWIIAMVFFFIRNTDTEGTPSSSNALNSECILFDIFDAHDIWHISSAFGLFFSFCGILTLDDDLVGIPLEQISVF